MSDRPLAFNGIHSVTGDLAFPELTELELADFALREKTGDQLLREISERQKRISERQWRHDPPQGIDPRDLAETGWGVVFSEDTPAGVRRALSNLLEFRRDRAGRKDDRYYREFVVPNGLKAADFLLDQGATPYETAHPSRIPYYLLLVASPKQIPFRFQYELGLQYAVGRLCLESLNDYRQYADQVIAAEARAQRPKRVSFFGVENIGNRASLETTEDLVIGLADRLTEHGSDWSVDRALKAEASKARLKRLLGDQAPALLFAAGHGLVLPPDDPAQEALQGALVCSDWPGSDDPGRRVRPEHFFAANDLRDESKNISGLIMFLFACYGAGTPSRDAFDLSAPAGGKLLSRKPFISGLCRSLLSHGATAVIGHVERTWTSGFRWPGGATHIETFTNAMKRLLDGYPVGSALSRFAVRHGQLSAQLKNLEDHKNEEGLSDAERRHYSRLWRGNRDARNFIVVGDPAVRLSVSDSIV